MRYLIREYPLQQGALEIAYIEEFFNEFPKRKAAAEILQRLEGRESQILMAEAPLADDPATAFELLKTGLTGYALQLDTPEMPAMSKSINPLKPDGA